MLAIIGVMVLLILVTGFGCATTGGEQAGTGAPHSADTEDMGATDG